MLKKLILENWKSFRYAELPIDPLTVLIGTNASGKSNAIEALEFLKRIAQGLNIQDALTGNSDTVSIRGSAEGVVLKPEFKFTLKVILQGEKEYIDYSYEITIETIPALRILAESLTQINQVDNSREKPESVDLFLRKKVRNSSVVELSDKFDIPSKMRESNFPLLDGNFLSAVLKFMPSIELFGGKIEEDDLALKVLENLFVLDPIPSKMRSYSPLSGELLSDASNIAGVIAALPKEKKDYVESNILGYVSQLPEKDIQGLWAETVGQLNSDAMLYCEEAWVLGEPPLIIDARGMSDGTLRFIAIVTALLTRPEGSQLVIEEVDNGLHPSRAELLLKMLKELGAKRKIDILVTTHNPALLNALEPEMIPFVVVAHRDAQTGESKLTPLDDIQRLPKLLASGHIGDLATQGSIEKSLSQ
jgi:predicted ATPase